MLQHKHLVKENTIASTWTLGPHRKHICYISNIWYHGKYILGEWGWGGGTLGDCIKNVQCSWRTDMLQFKYLIFMDNVHVTIYVVSTGPSPILLQLNHSVFRVSIGILHLKGLAFRENKHITVQTKCLQIVINMV